MLRFGHFFFRDLWRWYLHAALTAIRAQIKRDKRRQQVSLRGVLEAIPSAYASDPEAFFEKPEEARRTDLVDMLRTKAKRACDHVDQRIAHRDANALLGVDVSFDDVGPIIELLDAVMEEVWHWVFGRETERVIVDVDPYWATFLFAQGWAPPTEFDERVSLGSEARLTTETGRRQFTRSGVWQHRPTNAELSKMGLKREEYEARLEAGEA